MIHDTMTQYARTILTWHTHKYSRRVHIIHKSIFHFHAHKCTRNEWSMLTLRQVCFQENPGSAICVQNFDDSQSSAIRKTYHISLRSSSLKEPRHPLLKVVIGRNQYSKVQVPNYTSFFGFCFSGLLRLIGMLPPP